ncbi:hypothetical protein ABEG18_05520 [Alsobacter sp. KACC 23698]|uniref:Calcium-binding protein n=1 Tax=Alsobacter sp. KACC 23698 TaxID=3149229 RepID=A0AAU7JJ48_9HYPH
MSATYEAFLHDLAFSESTNRYNYVNSLGYAGAYQFGESALRMIGYYTNDGTAAVDWNNGWTGKDGIASISDWLTHPAVQDKAAGEWFGYLWNTEIKDLGLQAFDGQVMDGAQITASGIVAASHLVGADSVARYLNSGGTAMAADPFGTTVSTYLHKFSGYDFSGVTGVSATSADASAAPTSTVQAPAPAPSAPSGGGSTSSTASPDPVPPVVGQTLTGTNKGEVLEGGAGNDTITGGGGKDQIIGGAGDDKLWGGAAADTFTFKAQFGHDVVEDFDFSGRNHDVLNFDSALFADVGSVLSHTTDTSNGALITDSAGDSVLLLGVSKAQLGAVDFHFF